MVNVGKMKLSGRGGGKGMSVDFLYVTFHASPFMAGENDTQHNVEGSLSVMLGILKE